MGVLSDLVIARQSDAESIANEYASGEQWESTCCNGLDMVKLATLRRILDGSDVLDLDQVKLLAEASDEGPWVFLIPDEITDHLLVLSDAEESHVQNLAQQWAETEEFQEWDLASVTEMLVEMCKFAKRARLENKGLLLWMCL